MAQIELPENLSIDEQNGELIVLKDGTEIGRFTPDGLTVPQISALTSVVLPKYDELSNAPSTEGVVVYATGDGSDDAGVYKHDGASYAQLGGGGGGGVSDFRTSDPDNPDVGQAWYRTDLNVVRRNADGNIVEERSVFDVPTVQTVEDFEGKTASDLNKISFQGSPLFSVVTRDGSDWAEIDCADGDTGGIIAGNNDNVWFKARLEISNSDGNAIVSRGQDPNSQGTLFLIVSGSGGLSLNYYDSSGTTNLDSASASSSELVGSPVDVKLNGQENGQVTFEVVTTQNTYTLSGSVGSINPEVALYGQGQGGPAKVYYDYAESVQDEGELSPDLGYLRNPNVPIGGTEPTDSDLWYDTSAERLQKYDTDTSEFVDIVNGELITPTQVFSTGTTGISINREEIILETGNGLMTIYPNQFQLSQMGEFYLAHAQDNPFKFRGRNVPVVIESDNGASSVEVTDSGVSIDGNNGASSVEVTDSGVSLVDGTSSVEVTDSGVSLDGYVSHDPIVINTDDSVTIDSPGSLCHLNGVSNDSTFEIVLQEGAFSEGESVKILRTNASETDVRLSGTGNYFVDPSEDANSSSVTYTTNGGDLYLEVTAMSGFYLVETSAY